MHFKRQLRLIQDINEYRLIVEPYLLAGFENTQKVRPNEHQMQRLLEWVIAEQLAECRCMFSTSHHRFLEPYRSAYSWAKNLMDEHHPMGMDILTCAYIKAPVVYGDETVDIELNASDLTIHYRSNSSVVLPPSFTTNYSQKFFS